MTESLDVSPKTTEQNLIVRTGKSVAKVTSNKRLRSRYVLLQLTTDRHEASRGLSVTAERLACLVLVRIKCKQMGVNYKSVDRSYRVMKAPIIVFSSRFYCCCFSSHFPVHPLWHSRYTCDFIVI